MWARAPWRCSSSPPSPANNLSGPSGYPAFQARVFISCEVDARFFDASAYSGIPPSFLRFTGMEQTCCVLTKRAFPFARAHFVIFAFSSSFPSGKRCRSASKIGINNSFGYYIIVYSILFVIIGLYPSCSDADSGEFAPCAIRITAKVSTERSRNTYEQHSGFDRG